MIKFKRQTNRSTKMDETDNINLFLKNFSFGVVTSNYWGSFNSRDKDYKEVEESHKPHTRENPLIEITLDGINFELTLEELKRMFKENLKGKDFKVVY
jgi:hypothetical protein